MGRYTVEIMVNSVARTVVCVDATGPTPRITQLTGPSGSPEPDVPIDLAMLMLALRPADQLPAASGGDRSAGKHGIVIGDATDRPRRLVRRAVPAGRGGPTRRRPVSP